MRSLSIAIAVVIATVTPASAAVTRYALVFGNDAGDRDEARLRYAERDADRFAGVLGDLGGFAPANITILHGADADTTRAALIALNDRIRTNGPNESMLVVYYSGHADADALHLGTSMLPLPQLEQLVRGSSATFRLLILDSCRVLDRERRERRRAGVRRDSRIVLHSLLGLRAGRSGRLRR